MKSQMELSPMKVRRSSARMRGAIAWTSAPSSGGEEDGSQWSPNSASQVRSQTGMLKDVTLRPRGKQPLELWVEVSDTGSLHAVSPSLTATV